MTLDIVRLQPRDKLAAQGSISNPISTVSAQSEDDQILQDDPCLAKTKVVGDVQYCDRYWECEFGEPELYDCPNGLVWVGKNQGIADGCDYPWRHSNICKNKDLASKYSWWWDNLSMLTRKTRNAIFRRKKSSDIWFLHICEVRMTARGNLIQIL